MSIYSPQKGNWAVLCTEPCMNVNSSEEGQLPHISPALPSLAIPPCDSTNGAISQTGNVCCTPSCLHSLVWTNPPLRTTKHHSTLPAHGSQVVCHTMCTNLFTKRSHTHPTPCTAKITHWLLLSISASFVCTHISSPCTHTICHSHQLSHVPALCTSCSKENRVSSVFLC